MSSGLTPGENPPKNLTLESKHILLRTSKLNHRIDYARISVNKDFSKRFHKKTTRNSLHVHMEKAVKVRQQFLERNLFIDTSALWRYMWWGPFPNEEAFLGYLSDSVSGPRVTFTVINKPTNEKIGIVTYLNIESSHRKLEVGGIWYSPKFQRTHANTESLYLLIKYAFEDLKYRRVEWKCDNQNEKSKAAAQRLGFIFEGIFRQHYIIKGKNRDTAWFSILDTEWPQVKQKLEFAIEEKYSKS